LSLQEYESFLPGGVRLRQLVDWVRQYLCFELAWDVRLHLKKQEVPPLRLARGARLGWTTWLGHRRAEEDAADVCLDAEVLIDPVRAGAA
jgi:type VI secretion system protein ImpH